MGLYKSVPISIIHLPHDRLCRVCVPRSPYSKVFWLLLLLISLLFYGLGTTQQSSNSADILDPQPNTHGTKEAVLFMDCNQYDCHMCARNGDQKNCNYCPMPNVTVGLDRNIIVLRYDNSWFTIERSFRTVGLRSKDLSLQLVYDRKISPCSWFTIERSFRTVGLRSKDHSLQLVYDRKISPCSWFTIERSFRTGLSPVCKDSCNRTVVPYSRPTPGQWVPKDCTARSKIAIVIPYRDRRQHLDKFLKLMVPYFQRQYLDFTLIVAEQNGQLLFNKGRIMNAAFEYVTVLSNKSVNSNGSAFGCIVFHDVDMIPESDGPYYGCAKSVKHLGAYVKRGDQFSYRLMYPQLVGGVASFPLQSYQKINGFSNKYWGWGGEDDDMGFRLMENGAKILRDPRKPVYFYSMYVHHQRPRENYNEIMRLLKTARSRWKDDGLNQAKENYNIVQINETPDYHHLLIDVGDVPDIWLKKKSIKKKSIPSTSAVSKS